MYFVSMGLFKHQYTVQYQYNILTNYLSDLYFVQTFGKSKSKSNDNSFCFVIFFCDEVQDWKQNPCVSFSFLQTDKVHSERLGDSFLSQSIKHVQFYV